MYNFENSRSKNILQLTLLPLAALVLASCGSDSGGGNNESGASAQVYFSSAQPTASPGTESGDFVFTLKTTADPLETLDVTFSLGNNTASTDDFSSSLDTTIAACSSCPEDYTYTLSVAEDAIDEFDEIFDISIATINGEAPTTSNLLTITGLSIIDDDNPPFVTITNNIATDLTEDANNVVGFDVDLALVDASGDSIASGKPVTVGFDFSGDAVYGSDFSGPSSVTFQPGETSKTAAFTVLDDSFVEGRESLAILLDAAASSNVAIDTSGDTKPVTINDDTADVFIGISFSAATADVTEDGSGDTIKVVASSAVTSNATITLSYTDGTAISGSDYNNTAIASVTINAGDTSVDLDFTQLILDDAIVEEDETFDIGFAALVSSGTADDLTLDSSRTTLVVTIEDDDNQPPFVVEVDVEDSLPLTAKSMPNIYIHAHDDENKITHYIIDVTTDLVTTPPSPADNDSRWIALAPADASTDVTMDVTNFSLGDVSRDTYVDKRVWVWVMDELALVSSSSIAVTSQGQSTPYDDIEQTSPILFAQSGNETPDPLINYQWHLENTGQANFDSNAGTAGIDINLAPLAEYGVKGRGVLVNVVDSGLEIAHPDLVDNVVPGGSDDLRDGAGGDVDPSPLLTDVTGDGDHGTSVAGIIAMREGNGVGGSGVAPRVDLIGHNFLYPGSLQTAADRAIAYSAGDIVNLSLGTSPTRIASINQTLDALINNELANGRNNLGRIYVKSAGNGFEDRLGYDCTLANAVGQSCHTAQDDSTNTLPGVIMVGAVNADGVKSSYSSTGSSIWVSGLGGESGFAKDMSTRTSITVNGHTIWENYLASLNVSPVLLEMAMLTTDVAGCGHGYSRAFSYTGTLANVPKNFFEYSHNGSTPVAPTDNPDCDYTSTFNGTSSAAPTISGVVALMLEANPTLNYWDVRHILAATSRKIDPGYSVHAPTAAGGNGYNLSPGWVTNAAGYNFSDWYGFGLVDAAAAVEMAYSYSSNIVAADITVDSTQPAPFVNNNATGSSVSISISGAVTAATVLSVSVRPVVYGPYETTQAAAQLAARDVQIELASPSGTRYVMQGAGHGHTAGWLGSSTTGGTTNHFVYSFHSDQDQRLTSNAFYGEAVNGDWTLHIMDLFDSTTPGGTGDSSTGVNLGIGGYLGGWALDITYQP